MIFNPVYGGDASPNLGTKTITQNGTYSAASDNLDGYSEVTANVPNTYAAADEGKVVSSGALVSQSAATYTTNDTYDTTLINSVTVNVSGSSPTLITKTITENGTYDAEDDNADGYSSVTVNVPSSGGVAAFAHVTYTAGATCTATDGVTTLTAPDTSGSWIVEIPTAGSWTFTAVNGQLNKSKILSILYATANDVAIPFNVDNGYTEVEYIEVQNATGPYINTGLTQNSTTYYEMDVQPITGVNGFFYGALNSPYTEIEATSSNFNIYINGTNSSRSHGMTRHTIKAYENVLSMDGTDIRTNVTWPNTNAAILLFARSNTNTPYSYAKGIRIYHLKMWQNGSLARDFFPCYRNNDNAPGLFDSVNRVFYPNLGSGSIVAGPAV